jgi:hypothetical protein
MKRASYIDLDLEFLITLYYLLHDYTSQFTQFSYLFENQSPFFLSLLFFLKFIQDNLARILELQVAANPNLIFQCNIILNETLTTKPITLTISL